MNILVAISGSISAYKLPDLCKSLQNQGHSVKEDLVSLIFDLVKKMEK